MPRLLLLALVVALLGTAPAARAAAPPPGGTAFEPAPQSLDVYDVDPPNAQRQHTVKAGDGADIFVETYLPKQRAAGPAAPARVPIVLISTPYDSLYQGLGYYKALEHLVRRGYGVSIQHVRGTGNSGGCLEQTAARQIDDTARVIDFLGTRVPYTTGNVGMYGVSYDAETQVSVAGLGDPRLIAPLKAIVPAASVGGQYEYSNYDGVPFENQALFSNAFYFPISAAPGLASPTGQYPQQKLSCQGEVFQASLDDSGDMTPFWADREYRGGAPAVRAATLYVHGLRDFNVLPQTIRGWFDRLPASTPHKGLFGVWEHAEPDGGRVEPDWRRADWLAMLTAWYDRWLKGLDTQVEAWPGVQVQDSTGRWRAEDEFPLTPGPARQLALAPGGTLGATRAPSGSTTFEEDGEAVAFRTGKLAEPLSITGQPVLDLWLTSSAPDAHLAAELQVLGPDGRPLRHTRGDRETYGLRSLRHLDPIRDGWFRQRLGKPAPTGTPIRVPLRFLPTDLVVPRGGELRLVLTGLGDEPRTAKPSGAGSRITLLHECATPSTLRFLQADPAAPQLNVREPGEGRAPLSSQPQGMGEQDGGGIAAGPVCGREPSEPEQAIADPDTFPVPAPATTPGREGREQDAQKPGEQAGGGRPAAGAAQSRGRCGAPVSRLTRTSRIAAGPLRLRGTADGRGCTVRRMSVAIGRKVGRRCRFLRADGTWGPRTSCLRTRYLRARGTTRWSFERRLRLPRGSYVVWSRAVNEHGDVEPKAKRRNLMRVRVARRR